MHALASSVRPSVRVSRVVECRRDDPFRSASVRPKAMMEIDAKHKISTYQCIGKTYILNLFSRRYLSRYYLSRVPRLLCYLGYLCIQYECRGFRLRSVADARAGVSAPRARALGLGLGLGSGVV